VGHVLSDSAGGSTGLRVEFDIYHCFAAAVGMCERGEELLSTQAVRLWHCGNCRWSDPGNTASSHEFRRPLLCYCISVIPCQSCRDPSSQSEKSLTDSFFVFLVSSHLFYLLSPVFLFPFNIVSLCFLVLKNGYSKPAMEE